MGKTSQKEKRLAGRVSLALAAGMFSVVPTAYGMPTFDRVNAAHTNGANVTFGGVAADAATNPKPASGAVIDSNLPNTIIDWKDFSVGANEHVKFADNKNFMNIVTGTATSDIEGRISGSGDIYLINPHGVIFGGAAKVDVGNLYVSTKNVDAAVKTAFLDGNNAPTPTQTSFSSVLTALDGNMAAAATADVVNLIDSTTNGYVRADTVVMEGRNIRFLDSSSVIKKGTGTLDNATGVLTGGTPNAATDTSKLVLRTGTFDAAAGTGYIHVGDANGNYVYSTNKGVVGNTSDNKAAKENLGVVNYNLIRNDSSGLRLQDINNAGKGNAYAGYGLSGNYMLADDIDASSMDKTIGAATSTNDDGPNPLTGDSAAFSGCFDGMYHTVNNFHPTKDKNGNVFDEYNSYAGLFAYTNGATIENVGIKNANIQTYRAGGIVGYAYNTTLRNVWNEGGTGQIGSNPPGLYTGGIIGAALHTKLINAYNAGKVYGAGLVGYLTASEIRNAYNVGYTVAQAGDGNTDANSKIYGIYSLSEAESDADKNTIVNTFSAVKYLHPYLQTGDLMGDEQVGPEPAEGDPSTLTNSRVINSASDLSSWISSVGADISADGGSGKTWRYYANLPTVTFTNTDTAAQKAEKQAIRRASLPMLTAFFKGTVSTDYNYTGEQTQGTSGTFNSLDDNPAHKVYDATGVFAYTKADNGAYVIKNGQYVPYTSGDTGDRYDRTTVINYLGMNVATPTDANNNPTGITINDRKDVVGSAEKFALLYSGQQGYDLYGNNFRLDKRNLSLSLTGTALNKVYDGTNTKEVDFSTVQTPTDYISGLIAGDTVGVTGKLLYTYYTNENKSAPDPSSGQPRNCDFGTKYVEITPGTGFGPTEGAGNNYTINLTPPATLPTAEITRRKVKVGLKQSTGLDKVYDATSAVVFTSDTLGDLSGSGNINTDISAVQNVEGDGVNVAQLLSDEGITISANNVTSNYVGTDGTTPNANVAFDENGAVTTKNIVYTGDFALATNNANTKLSNYEVVSKIGATGTISQREIAATDIHYPGTTEIPVTKTYDGTSALPGDAVAAGTAVTVDAPTATKATGVVAADAAKVMFETTGTGAFYAADGTTEARNSTGSGLDNIAAYAGYGVRLTSGSDPTTVKNYKITPGTTTTTLAKDTDYNVLVAGEITKRDITVALKETSGINKIYDGTTAVTGTSANNVNWATGNWKITNGSLADDGTSIAITSANYGALSGTGFTANKDVVYASETSDVVPTNGKTIRYVITLSDDNDNNTPLSAGNYNLKTAVAPGNETQEVTLNATGWIDPRKLIVSFDTTAQKTYDESAAVKGPDNEDTDIIVPTIAAKTTTTGLTGNDGFTADTIFKIDYNNASTDSIHATYGNYVNGVFTENENTTATDVQYTNLQKALKSRNYTVSNKNQQISNTLYGKGAITTKQIDIGTLKSYVNPKNTLEKTYDGSAYKAGAAGLAAKNYLEADTNLSTKLKTDINALIASGKMTIAEAVYYDNTGTKAKDAGNYGGTNAGYVAMKFVVANQNTAEGAFFDFGNYKFQTGDFIEDAAEKRAGVINKQNVTVGVLQTPTKVYDGTTVVRATGVSVNEDTKVSTIAAANSSDWFTLTPETAVTGDNLALVNTITAAYTGDNAKDTGNNKTVKYTGLALSNDLAKNYDLVDKNGQSVNEGITGAGTITARKVTVNGYGFITKTWTGDDTYTGAYALSVAQTTEQAGKDAKTDWAVLAGDHITSDVGVINSGLTAKYIATDAEGASNVNRSRDDLHKTVTYTGLANKFGSNYEVGYGTDASTDYDADVTTGSPARTGGYDAETDTLTVAHGGKIDPAQLRYNDGVAVAGVTKTYDGKRTLPSTVNALDQLTFTDANLEALKAEVLEVVAVFDDKNVDTERDDNPANNRVTYTITGKTSTGNYTLDFTGDKTEHGYGKILPTVITVSADGLPSVTKEYDGNKDVNAAGQTAVNTFVQSHTSGQVSVGGVQEAVGVSVTYTDAYDTKKAETGKTVTYALALSGNADVIKNYTLASDSIEGTGIITKKQIALDLVLNNIEKTYDGSASTAGSTLVGTATETFEQELTRTFGEWKTAWLQVAPGEKVNLDTSGLVGAYGSWNPKTGAPEQGAFATNAHVKYVNNQIALDNYAAQDVLYYGFGLTGDDAANYEFASGTDTTKKTAFGSGKNITVDSASLAETVYFYEAKDRGMIKPIAISMEGVKSRWTTPIEKVYDGSSSVAGYDTTGAEKKATEYLKFYYDVNYNESEHATDPYDATKDIDITYTLGPGSRAEYTDAAGNASASAEMGKKVIYSGLLFQTNGDFLDEDGDEILDAITINNHFANSTFETTGNIAKRLLVVSTDKESHTKTYDGDAALFYVINQDGSKTYEKTYNVAKASAENIVSGIVKIGGVDDDVSVTYVANFATKDVNFNEGTQSVGNKDVTYVFTLGGTSKDNYELSTGTTYPISHTGETWAVDAGTLTKVLADGKIEQREVELAFENNTQNNIDKTYDKTDTADVSGRIKLAYKDRDVVDGDDILPGDITAKYQPNGTEAAEDVAFDANGAVTTKTVSVQNVNFVTGNVVNRNYKVKNALTGTGKIKQREIGVTITDNVKEYDGTAIADKDHVTVTVPATGFVDDDDKTGFQLLVDSAIYYDKTTLQGETPENPTGYAEAGTGLGVVYRLKWNNTNYTLEHVQYAGSDNGSVYGSGEIKPRTLKVKDGATADKIYDGTTAITDASLESLFENVADRDKGKKLADITTTTAYLSADTGASQGSIIGEAQDVKFSYTLTEENNIRNNYQIDNTGSYEGEFNGKGHINRAPLTLAPTPVSYYPDTVPTSGYGGTVKGFVNDADKNDYASSGYSATFDRGGDTRTATGSYALVGYVNGQKPEDALLDAGTANEMSGLAYNNLRGGLSGNYYFVGTEPNEALTIKARPTPDPTPTPSPTPTPTPTPVPTPIPDLTPKLVPEYVKSIYNIVQDTVISDKKFTPDDFSYTRISKDQDPTHMVRESSASLQYSEKGVNLDGGDTKSGLAALADIQGTGSVVNLEGAFIRTSAPAEQPETVAAEAALPVPETEESDISSISLEYAGDGDNSQALLEILTNASSNAEKKGTSIVIDAQDEDEEDAEEEKSRRAIFADRSNIGIETLGNAVNLNQMIG